MSTELKTAAIGTARDYQNLPAWQKSMLLAEQVFEQTEQFPAREHAGLAAQLRQTATYVASAIAAASAASDSLEISEFYREAQSALAELSTQLQLAERLKYVEASDAQDEIDAITRLLIGMQHGLKIAARDAERAEQVAQREERSKAREERGGDRPFKKPYEKRDGGEDRPRREFKPRDRDDRGGDRPYKKPYQKREGGEDRPRRDFKRDDARGGDRPYKKPYQKREDGDAPRREYKPRDRDARPARDGGDRPYKKREDTRGDRQGYGGSKKPYVKRDFGGKPKPRRDRD
ncbi:MAG: four helix bundle protein [Alphaproteobacteria bacterium]|nr:four helix bundle protein [Alphaproteobacteria bacterium]